VIRKTCIEDPSLKRAYCTKCKRVRKTDSFRRLPRRDLDGNEYERSCLSCLKKPNPMAAAPLGAPTASHEASHAPFIEHDENSANQQRPVSQEECSSSHQVIKRTSTAGNTDNNMDSSSNPARWTLGDALRLDYTSRISQLTNEINSPLTQCLATSCASQILMRLISIVKVPRRCRSPLTLLLIDWPYRQKSCHEYCESHPHKFALPRSCMIATRCSNSQSPFSHCFFQPHHINLTAAHRSRLPSASAPISLQLFLSELV
jgi:hypothetical protein